MFFSLPDSTHMLLEVLNIDYWIQSSEAPVEYSYLLSLILPYWCPLFLLRCLIFLPTNCRIGFFLHAWLQCCGAITTYANKEVQTKCFALSSSNYANPIFFFLAHTLLNTEETFFNYLKQSFTVHTMGAVLFFVLSLKSRDFLHGWSCGKNYRWPIYDNLSLKRTEVASSSQVGHAL